jgi:hypothetical protein
MQLYLYKYKILIIIRIAINNIASFAKIID